MFMHRDDEGENSFIEVTKDWAIDQIKSALEVDHRNAMESRYYFANGTQMIIRCVFPDGNEMWLLTRRH
jgi:hypothetical protein